MADDSLGIIAVGDVPDYSRERSRLLPMAAELANLDTAQLTSIERPDTKFTVGWGRGKERMVGSQHRDVNRCSFYANPLEAEPRCHVDRRSMIDLPFFITFEFILV